jgi:predicted negative regulator of RcsB-dependent stress response
MQDFETEEQQIEALKKWWHENSTSLMVGLALGVAAIFGGRYYIDMQRQQSANAGDLYYQVAEHVNNKREAAAMEITDKLITEYKATPYSSMASLLMARYEYEQSRIEEATKQLDWVVKNSGQPELQNIARLRLARVHLASKEYDLAESLLTVNHPAAFDAVFEELKGDIYLAKNQLAEARIAYDKAIAAEGAEASSLLRLKRQDLGNDEVVKADQVEPPA